MRGEKKKDRGRRREKERNREHRVETDKCSGNERKRRIERAGYRARGFACFGTGRVSDIYMRFAY